VPVNPQRIQRVKLERELWVVRKHRLIAVAHEFETVEILCVAARLNEYGVRVFKQTFLSMF
jgi:hypothetical protein